MPPSEISLRRVFNDAITTASTATSSTPYCSPPKPVKVGAAPTGDDDVFDVESIVIEMMPDGVTRTAKAKGGKWTKYGVKVWDEVLALPPLEWDLQQLDVADYGPPKGLKAIVMMAEGKPRKVTGWA